MKLFSLLLDFFFPQKCLGCKDEGQLICNQCLNSINISLDQVCPICKVQATELGQTCLKCKSLSHLSGVLVASTDNSKLLKKLIHRFKYNFTIEAGNYLGNILLKSFVTHYLSNADLILVPVPLHSKREKWRGFNQSEVLAGILSQATNTCLEKQVLSRIKYTTPQMTLNREARLKNLLSAFQINFPRLNFLKEVVLVDDVMTTGTTLEECAKILKQNGVKKVWGLVLTRGT